jgi:hypothetical protein
MRTYLKNWMALKSTKDLRLLYVYSDWELTNKKIELKTTFNDIPNKKLIITYQISNDTVSSLVKIQDDVYLYCSWMALPAGHQIQIIAMEGSNITDDETIQTDSLLT